MKAGNRYTNMLTATLVAMGGAWFAATTQAGTAAYRNTVLADNPVLYYEFDETSGTTATNSGATGATHDGTISGTVALGQGSFSLGGTAYDFGGGRVTAAPLASSLTEWTVEAWVNIDGTKTTRSHILSNDQGGWNDDVLFGLGVESGSQGVPAGNMGLIQQAAPEGPRDFVTKVFNAYNVWRHVVVTASESAGVLKLYVDGGLVDTDSSMNVNLRFNGGDGIGTADLAVGQRSASSATDPYEGLLDELAIYGTALDAATIRTHYQAGIVPTIQLSSTTVVSNAAPATLVGTLSDPSGVATSFVLTNAPAGGSAADNGKFQITEGTNLRTRVEMTQLTNHVSIAGVANGVALVTNSFEITLTLPSSSGPWYRGNTHCHTTESDGDTAPSTVVAWYHDQGYNFLLLTDHNRFVDPATVPMPANARDDFILVPGEEITGSLTIHTTAMNIDSLAAWSASGTKTEVIQGHVHSAREHGGEAILNHPNFHYAVSAADMLPVTNLTMFELINGHPSVNNHGDASHDSTEEMWDDMLTAGMRICAVAADDTHHLQSWGTGKANPGRGWVMVKADELTPDAITAAMTNGDFYASCGVFFDTYELLPDRYSISVDTVRTQAELAEAFALGQRRSDVSAGWTLEFIGPDGSVLSQTNATSADYIITGDPLYVRAKATFAREVATNDFECFYAWGQPVYPGDPAPSDIRILGNGLTIHAGDLTPEALLGTDFGVTTQSLTRTFTITNQSTTTTIDLTNSPRVTVTDSAGHFALSQDAASGSLLPGGATTFDVTYAPSSQGTHTALVSVASTDSNQLFYAFAIAGIRPGPPTVTNEGASAFVANSATLSGRLTGGQIADAWIFFGASDGGTNDPANWDSPHAIGSVSQGEPLSVDVSGLLYDVEYSYRVYASNSVGTAWSDVASFVIPQPTWELIAKYALENNYEDSSGNGYHGAVVGNGYLTNEAQRGWVYCNPDGNSAVNIEATRPIPNLPANRNVTVAAWVKPEESGTYETIMSLGRNGDAPIMQMGVNGWGLHGYIEGDADQVVLDGTDNAVPQGVWTHVAIVCDRVNDIATLYVDGALDVSFYIASVGDGEVDWHFASLMGAFTPDNTSNPLVGCIDDAHIYYDALDAVAVSNLYAGGLNQAPIRNTSAANITTTTADLKGTLNAPQSDFTVYVYYGTNDNADASTWLNDSTATNLWVGTYTNVTGQSVMGSVSSLSADTTYYYTMMATNAATNIWASPNVSFKTKEPPSAPAVGNAGGATSSSATSATLRGELTAGGSASAWICWGPADAGGDISGTGTWQNVVAISPAVSEGVVFSNTVSGLSHGIRYNYAVYVSNAVDDAWSGVTNFTTKTPAVGKPDAYRNTVLADNPIIYYQFDETSGTTAINSGTLGASHNGAIVSSVTLNQPTFLNGGTSYDFGGGRVTAAAFSTLTEWTVEAWINWDSAKTSQSHIFGNDQGGWNDDVLFGIGTETGGLGVPANNVGLIQQGAPGSTRDFVKDPLSHSEWRHVVATGSTTDGELKLYVDGVLVDTDSSLANGMTMNGHQFAVGAARFVADAGTRPFDGLIDEFALYGTVLDATTISTHYKAGITPPPTGSVLIIR
jgi:hypothetical protein